MEPQELDTALEKFQLDYNKQPKQIWMTRESRRELYTKLNPDNALFGEKTMFVPHGLSVIDYQVRTYRGIPIMILRSLRQDFLLPTDDDLFVVKSYSVR